MIRKKVLPFIFSAILILGGNLYAQKITLGIKGGGSFSNQKGGKADNNTTFGNSVMSGAQGGIYGEYTVSKVFSFTAGAEYGSEWGYKDFLANSANYLTEVKLDYLTIPVLARINWKKSKRSPFKVYGALGPFVGILINGKAGRSQMPIEYLPPVKSGLNTINAGISGALGFSCNIKRNNALFIEVGANYGIIPIKKGNSQNYMASGVLTFGYAYTIQNKRRGIWR